MFHPSKSRSRSSLVSSSGDACFIRHSSVVFPTLAMEREQRSLGSGSVSTKEFQDCVWEGLRRIAEAGQESLGTVQFKDGLSQFST